MFRIGQKVICIDDKGVKPHLKEGNIYTITRIWENGLYDGKFLDVNESNPQGGWYQYRFRPIVERKTDISIFEKMLDTKKHKVPVDDLCGND